MQHGWPSGSRCATLGECALFLGLDARVVQSCGGTGDKEANGWLTREQRKEFSYATLGI